MYNRYINSIREDYRATLRQVAALIEKQYPVMLNPDLVMAEGLSQSDAYYHLTADMNTLAETFNLAFIYLIINDNGVYRFILDSTATPDIFEGLDQADYFLPYEATEGMIRAEQTKALYISPRPFTDEYGTFVSATVPVIQNGRIAGFIGADYEVSQIRSLEWRAAFTLIAALTFAVILSSLTALGASSSLIKPIKQVIAALETIARGDLSAKTDSRRKDELGDMMRLLESTREEISLLVKAIRDKADNLSAVGQGLTDTTIQSAEAVDRIKASTDGLKEKALNQNGSVSKTNAAVAQIIGSIDNLNNNIENQAESVSQSSAAVEEMTANIAAVTKSLLENAENINSLTAASEKGHAALQKVSAAIGGVVQESERLLEINKVIQNIASQTNLLAMNAAIEAAHAGDVGRGFAVVADEIRKLAENSGWQAKMVSQVLKTIRASLDGISGSTSQALSNFEAIDAEVRIVADQETRIRNAVEEQDSGSRAILETIARSRDITGNVRRGSEEMLESSKNVVDEGKTLEALTQDLSGGTENIAGEMGRIGAAVNRIQEIEQKNSLSIEELIREIAKFKIA
jgi:methyl-accepting chemotaxis protein